jgi:hypothetical protein
MSIINTIKTWVSSNTVVEYPNGIAINYSSTGTPNITTASISTRPGYITSYNPSMYMQTEAEKIQEQMYMCKLYMHRKEFRDALKAHIYAYEMELLVKDITEEK